MGKGEGERKREKRKGKGGREKEKGGKEGKRGGEEGREKNTHKKITKNCFINAFKKSQRGPCSDLFRAQNALFL